MASINELKGLASARGGFAQQHQYLITLPGLGAYSSRELNLLCSQTTLPSRRMLSSDRAIGVKQTRVAYGFATEEVTMKFTVLNDYGIKNYFEMWQNKIVNQNTFTPSYKSEYARDMQILQLRKGFALDTDLRLGPISIDIDIFKRENVIYECTLLNAFPVTLGEIALTNEPGVVELTVGFEYDNWRSSHFAVNPSTRNARAVGTLINTINNIVN
jgi:hypothetical protein